jgi:hypothetical protein
MAGVDIFQATTAPSTVFSSTVERNVTAYWDTVAPVVSVDAAGEYAVLGGIKGLNIIDLESPFKAARILHHNTRIGTTVARWNPSNSHLHFVASTSNLNVLIWNLERTSQAIVATMEAHKRSVNDVKWSPLEPNTIASCDADGFIYLWDLRTPRKPTREFCSIAKGTAQIQWNRFSGNILASICANKVELWDLRGGLGGGRNGVDGAAEETSFGSVFAAHNILGFDWSYIDAHEFLTCGDDKKVKFWRDNEPRSFASLNTPTAVWKAKYTPFGHGMVTTALRNDPTIRLWNLDNVMTGDAADLIQIYYGHDTQVRSFDWRFFRGRYQLISWGADKRLCLWRVELHHVKECGGFAGDFARRSSKGTNHPATTMKGGILAQKKEQQRRNMGRTNFGSRGGADKNKEKYNPNFLKADVDDYDNGDGFGKSKGTGEGYDYADDDILNGILKQNEGLISGDVEEWQEWSHAARSLEEEFDIIRRHLGGVMSGIPGAVVTVDFMSAVDRRCVVECVVTKRKKSAFARVSFDFPDDYARRMDKTYRSVPTINVLNGSPPMLISGLHWQSIARGMKKVAEKKAGKGRRSLEVLMRKLAKSIVRFVDSEMLGDSETLLIGSDLFQMEEESTQKDRIKSLRRLSEDLIDDRSAQSKGLSTTSNMSLKVGNVSTGIAFCGNSLVTFGGFQNVSPTRIKIANTSKMLRPFQYDLAIAYDLPPVSSLAMLASVCENNAASAKSRRHRMASEVWAIATSIVDPSLLNYTETSFAKEWSNHPLGKALLATVIKKLQRHNDIQTIAVLSAVLHGSGLLAPALSKECERIRHIYAEVLYRFGLFAERSVLLKRSLNGCLVYNPHTKLTPFTCALCLLTARKHVTLCIFCGHGGHVGCLREWYNDEGECPTGCGCQCKPLFLNLGSNETTNKIKKPFNRYSGSAWGNSNRKHPRRIMTNDEEDDDDDESSSDEEEEIEEPTKHNWRN